MYHARRTVRPRNRLLTTGFEPLEGRQLLSVQPLGPASSPDYLAASLPASAPILPAVSYSITPLQDLPVATNTGEKPQSKVWTYDNRWWSVVADAGGTAVFRLDGTAWTRVLGISSTVYHADIRQSGNLVHVLLEKGTTSKLASLEYVPGSTPTYKLWSARPSLTSVPLTTGIETATLDLDSTGRLWVASDAVSDVEVRYSDSPYTSFSAPIVVASGISVDDISAVAALPGKIGVLWSNQTTQRFGFRYHQDGDAPGTWSTAEVPADQSALSAGTGMADDHVNAVVASDGTLYAAVKTGYSTGGLPSVGLLVRRPDGSWDPFYPVDFKAGGHEGTRPIVLLNEALGRVQVAYRNTDTAGPIVYRESPIGSIAFGAEEVLIDDPTVNNVSSTKQTWTSEVVAIAADANNVLKSVVLRAGGNLPPAVSAGPDQEVTLPGSASLNGSVRDDGQPDPPGAVTTSWTQVSGPGAVTFADAAAVDTTATFSRAGTYVLRLTADDGALVTSDEITITVLIVNEAPVVNAGADQAIDWPASASLVGSVSDDGLPDPPARVTVAWSMVSGPGTVTFADAAAASTTASFSQGGIYVLRLTADDGGRSTSDDVVIAVNQAPVVNAGADQTINWPASASLAGSVSDDGLPAPPGRVTVAWSMVSGPGTVTFADAAAVNTTASFSQAGTYTLRLTAADGVFSTSDEIAITVNQAPVVDAGADQTVYFSNLSASADVVGLVSDDGLPAPPGSVTVSWSKLSGPGTVTFADSSQATTTVSFSEVGIYTLRLIANDGAVSASDDIVVTVRHGVRETVAFQDGVFPTARYASTADTRISRSASTSKYGSTTILPAVGGSGASGVLLRWDLSGIPVGASVQSATMTLNLTNPTTQVYELYALKRNWSEAQATWSVASTGVPWEIAGAQGTNDRDPTVLGTVMLNVTGTTTIALNDAGVAQVQAWINNPASNYGFVLQDYARTDALAISSSETATPSQRPRFEVTYICGQPQNQAPVVNAGADQAIALPALVSLVGSVTDDGLPLAPGAVAVAWSVVSGPGTVTFADASQASTTAGFSQAGTYTLRLTANDGELSTSDDLVITVQAASINQAPVVDAGPDQTITLPALANLVGSVSDDGKPNPPGSVTIAWNKLSGPGTVTFANPNQASTTASFSQAGTYTLRLTANDGALSASDDLLVTVGAGGPVTVAFQDGVSPTAGYTSTADTRISRSAPTSKYGSSTTLSATGGSGASGVLLRWDLSSIPAGSNVQSAAMTLNITSPTAQVYELYALKRNWNEAQATWNLASTGNAWEVAGAQGAGDRDSTVLGTIMINTTGTATFALNAAGVAQVQAWVNNPASNYGLVLQNYARTDGLSFRSSETATLSQRPRFEVSYVQGVTPAPALHSAASPQGADAAGSVRLWSALVDSLAASSRKTSDGKAPKDDPAAVADRIFLYYGM